MVILVVGNFSCGRNREEPAAKAPMATAPGCVFRGPIPERSKHRKATSRYGRAVGHVLIDGRRVNLW